MKVELHQTREIRIIPASSKALVAMLGAGLRSPVLPVAAFATG